MSDAARTLFSASISLLAGYSFLRMSYYRRFASESVRTDRFALLVLGYSFLFYVLGHVVAEFIPYWTPAFLEHVSSGLEAAGITTPVINAIFLGGLFAAFDNCRVRFLMRNDAYVSGSTHFEGLRKAAVARFVHKSRDAALRAIFRAMVLKKPLMVTLKSHKVYVGKPYILLSEDPTQALTFIKILPSKSGYRDPATKKVTLQTRYDELLTSRLVEYADSFPKKPPPISDPLASDVLGLTNARGEVVADVDLADMGVVISWAEVEALTIYDENLYKAFQDQAPLKKAATPTNPWDTASPDG